MHICTVNIYTENFQHFPKSDLYQGRQQNIKDINDFLNV